MAKSIYTKGPWEAKRSPDDELKVYGEHTAICVMGNLADDDHEAYDFPNAEANARLIAAAPDLLVALKQLADEAFRNMAGGKGHLIDNAYAAIAKATKQV